MTLSQAHKIPCPYFHQCGGCDFLDLNTEDYKKLKQNTLAEKYPAADWLWVGPHSRRRIILQISKKNEVGFFAKKSQHIVEIENCFVAEKEISQLISPLKNFLKKQEQNLFTQISITLFDNGLDLIFSSQKEPGFTQIQKIIAFAQMNNLNASLKIKNHLTPIFLARTNQIYFANLKISLDSEVFVQATKSGLQAIIDFIRQFLLSNNTTIEIADIYSGFGAFAFAISDLAKSISAFEGDKKMVDGINKNAASNNLSHKIKAEMRDLFSDPLNKKDFNKFDLAIINPPRNGATPQISEIAKSSLKNVIYVSCNPQSFLRDSKILIDSGFAITKLTALDQFYSTKHLELVSLFQK